MQLGLKPLLLRRLRAALQLIIPAAVAADTVRSCFVTYKLAQARLQVGGCCLIVSTSQP